MSAVAAIVWFDLKRFWASPLRILFGLTQPLLYLFVLGAALRSGTYAEIGGYQAYIFPGVVGLSLMFTAISAAVGIVHDRQTGLLNALLVSPVRRVDIALGKIGAGALLAWLQALLLLPFSPAIGIGLTAPRLALLVAAMAFAALAFSALGLGLALPFRSVIVFPVVSNTLLLPMFFLSGGLYPLDLAPDWIRAAAAFDPAAYGVDLMRGVLSAQYAIAPSRSIAALAACLVVAGTLVVRGVGRQHA
ncbi:ABC transporter permease [Burkholderia pseudomallei]|uniref:ABC transporter permease n=1 Tax=Burkholderia pseudomallei TaxID=28450 RepID=UPI0005F2F92C|nr:ABC transporter permease [Burkholderia pseudomallei]KJR94416.1 ABC transporter permease [Burkholderia pseudomallei]MDA5592358.1 ABC transporter permease [Burkholderia pseudomallei]OND57143.1 ABC transporter permease [Burkholderia pseudomallei]OND66403.1 ABC transporter permease [Burkholderia pseudomallei]OND77848.1 ABC transporter permease [Burkholderia pseudomallei]